MPRSLEDSPGLPLWVAGTQGLSITAACQGLSVSRTLASGGEPGLKSGGAEMLRLSRGPLQSLTCWLAARYSLPALPSARSCCCCWVLVPAGVVVPPRSLVLVALVLTQCLVQAELSGLIQ